jgi:DNA-binding MarR family transcriptional regulator
VARAAMTRDRSIEDPDLLYRRPGFLVRRLHQAATAIFAAEAGEIELTQLQYGALVLLEAEPELDQITLGRRLGLDRSTIGTVVHNLEERAYLERVTDPDDSRRRLMTLTPAGRALLARMFAPAHRAQERLLAALDPAERRTFLAMLERLNEALNDEMPTPVEPPSSSA